MDLLCQRRKETIPNLAAELGVSERTIRRDIEMLTLRYPIETVCGRYGGGVRMADWYQQGRRRLTPRQTALLRRLAAGLEGEDLEDMKQILTQFVSWRSPQWAPLLFDKFIPAVRFTTRAGVQRPP